MRQVKVAHKDAQRGDSESLTDFPTLFLAHFEQNLSATSIWKGICILKERIARSAVGSVEREFPFSISQ